MWPVGVMTLPVPVNEEPSAAFAEMPTVAARTWSAIARVAGGSAASTATDWVAAKNATIHPALLPSPHRVDRIVAEAPSEVSFVSGSPSRDRF